MAQQMMSGGAPAPAGDAEAAAAAAAAAGAPPPISLAQMAPGAALLSAQMAAMQQQMAVGSTPRDGDAPQQVGAAIHNIRHIGIATQIHLTDSRTHVLVTTHHTSKTCTRSMRITTRTSNSKRCSRNSSTSIS
jgi:hypothetical protein